MSKRELDFSDFPPGTVTEYTTLVCLACIFDIFTKQFGLAPRSAYSEIKRYSPTIKELTARLAVRPFFDSEDKHPRCPYCNAAKRWHARLDTQAIEGGKTSDTARRALVKTLAKKGDQFAVLELKSDRRTAFFDWLDTLRIKLDLNEEGWLLEATRAILERREPKTDWIEMFEGVRAVRPSSRLPEGWKRDGSRLFLAPTLYNEALLVQYLVSRSHEHGGRTLEGRLTLMELIRRLRRGGYLQAHGITETNQFEILEKLLDEVAGSGQLKLYFVVDRREFLEKVKSVYASYAS
ncbi:MAG TPA: hypothetical protein VGQ39_10945 [Pyrinomonadaceae bacterium]|jgi:hypothetical protein|nr:hypothetical protein [Pyrinomonadaceae bacterium]